MKNVLVLGGLSYNMMIYLAALPEAIPQTIFSQGHHETIGGTGAGKALNLSKLGFHVTFHALLGEDYFGSIIQSLLSRQKNLHFIWDVDPLGTQRHLNLMDNNGGRISIYINPGTFEPIISMSRLEELIQQQDHIVLNIDNYCRRLIPAFQRAGKPIWCDIHDYDGKNPYYQDFIDAAETIFMSSDGVQDYRMVMENLVWSGKKLVVCTHGRDGSTALTGDGYWIETPITQEFQAVDSNGAGDAFFAGFLYGHSQGYPIEKCLQMASIAGGLCVTSHELACPELCPEQVEIFYQKMLTYV